MAALVGLALLGQVICIGSDACAQPPAEPEVAAEVTENQLPECDLPVCGSLGRTLYCIEGYESHHYGGAVNPSSGARGWLQWLAGTARRWGVTIGDRQSEWLAAAQIASVGRSFFVSQWVPLQRGLC